MSSQAPGFAKLSEGLHEESILPEDMTEVLQQLESPAGGAEDLLDEDASVFAEEDGEGLTEDSELDLSAGESDKASDPVRLYMREMGTVPLLKREQEVAIAKRIEWGQKRAQKAISRSPIAVVALLQIGSELEAGNLNIRDVVTFGDQMETEEHEDRSEEYLQWTIEGIQNIRKLYKRGLKELGLMREEQKVASGRGAKKTSKKLVRVRRKLSRTRLEIVQEMGGLHLKEATRQRLIGSIGVVHREV